MEASNDLTVSQAVQYGEVEINYFEPVVATRVFYSIAILTNGIRTLPYIQ
ncbi:MULTISPECIES: hypothetical protein [unclassified Pseudomonas]|nr:MULTISPECIES: hypothetical protein [unclassified Pseudomonas]